MAVKAIADYILPFLDYCEVEKGLSDKTQRNYNQYLKVFVGWLNKTGRASLRPDELTAQHVWEYRLYLARQYKTPLDRRLGKKSQNFYLIALRALLAYFADRDIESLPSSKIKLAKQKVEPNRAFMDGSEIQRMLDVPDTSKIDGRCPVGVIGMRTYGRRPRFHRQVLQHRTSERWPKHLSRP